MEPYGLRDPIGFATLLPREDTGYLTIQPRRRSKAMMRRTPELVKLDMK